MPAQEPSPKTEFISGVGRNKKRIGVFDCVSCGTEFEGPIYRIPVMTGRCRTCANREAGKNRSSHGMNNRNSRLHVTWANMKRRCVAPRGKENRIYRGVTLCHEWMEFEPFMKWSLENGYADDLTLDRIDSSKGYSPDNCRYVDYSVQAANRKITDKNKSGHVGVRWENGKWTARIQWRKRQVYLGRFERLEDAVSARNRYINENNLPHTKA